MGNCRIICHGSCLPIHAQRSAKCNFPTSIILYGPRYLCSKTTCLPFAPAPAQEVLEYQAHLFTSGFDGGLSPYQGPPSPALDEAWDALYDCTDSLRPGRYTNTDPPPKLILPGSQNSKPHSSPMRHLKSPATTVS